MPDEAYNTLLFEQKLPHDLDLEYLIIHGTPLPKNHGDLIDRGKLLNTLEELEWIRVNCSIDEDNTNILEDIVVEEPSILKADEEESEK